MGFPIIWLDKVARAKYLSSTDKTFMMLSQLLCNSRVPVEISVTCYRLMFPIMFCALELPFLYYI